MMELLEANPNLARAYHSGLHKVNTKEEWAKIAIELNSIGPPMRQGTEWMKVWADFKCNLKKKLLHNKAECRATGGGPHKQFVLTTVEEAASSLLQLDSIVNSDGEIGVSNTPLKSSYCPMDTTKENESSEYISTPRIRKKVETKADKTEKTALLENQLKVQTELYSQVKDSLQNVERYNRKIFKIKEEELKIYKAAEKREEEKFLLYKKELKSKEDFRNKLLKARTEEIEIKKRRIELDEWKSGIRE